ncbi:MAG TPA: hypothetical protein DCZ56_02455 [Sutterella sp.]|nr:hypothetical protein [Sutterella sp.]
MSAPGRELCLQAAAGRQTRSSRERLITDLLRAGLSNGAIAERLGLSPRSVQGHRNKVYQKLRVHNAADFASRMSVL